MIATTIVLSHFNKKWLHNVLIIVTAERVRIPPHSVVLYLKPRQKITPPPTLRYLTETHEKL